MVKAVTVTKWALGYGSSSVRAVRADYALKGRLAESRCSLLTAVKVDTVTVMHREVRTDLAIPDSWIAIIDPTPNGQVSVSRCLRCPTRSKLDRNHPMCNSRTAREEVPL